jgi:hypothetical protein
MEAIRREKTGGRQTEWPSLDLAVMLIRNDRMEEARLRIPAQGGHDSEIDPVSIPKLIRSRFRDEVGQGFRF